MTELFFGTSGPRDADIAIVGESWGSEEASRQRPFVGHAGQELNRMLAECGIARDSVFVTNVVAAQPRSNEMAFFFYSNAEVKERGESGLYGLYPKPIVREGIERLLRQLEIVKPSVIIALGNWSLWLLSQDCTRIKTDSNKKKGIPPTKQPSGILSWRGSQLYARAEFGGHKLVPMIHPAAILRQWALRYPTINDLKRRARVGMQDNMPWPHSKEDALSTRTRESRPGSEAIISFAPSGNYQFEIAPDRNMVAHVLGFLLGDLDMQDEYESTEGTLLPISVDTETRGGYIDCIGLAASDREAICIPFMYGEKGESYYTLDEELEVRQFIYDILTHPNALIIGQNFLYDMQHLDYELLGTPRDVFDTMLAQHLCWPGTPKGLDYLSSLYCRYHRYWKDEGKLWIPGMDDRQRWKYNCKDACAAFECFEVLRDLITKLGLEEQWDIQRRQVPMVLDMMLRGVRISTERRNVLAGELLDRAAEREAWLADALPPEITPQVKSKTAAPWYRSPIQQHQLFYRSLGVKEIHNPKTRSLTIDDSALDLIGKREPILLPLTQRLRELRSIKKFHEVCTAKLDPDNRMRCEFGIGGTETFRWNSGENAFGRGTNLQNLSKGTEE